MARQEADHVKPQPIELRPTPEIGSSGCVPLRRSEDSAQPIASFTTRLGTDVVIRRPQRGDEGDFDKLAINIWGFVNIADGFIINEIVESEEREFRDAGQHDIFLLAVADGKLVGYVKARKLLSSFLNWYSAIARRKLSDSVCELTIGVRRGYRNQGIGYMLLESIFGEAREAGYSAIFLDVMKRNKGAIHLYEKAGFSVGLETDPIETGFRKMYLLLDDGSAKLRKQQPTTDI